MTTRLKTLMLLALLNFIVFKIIIPIICVVKMILAVGEIDFYTTFFNYFLYGILSYIVYYIINPNRFLTTEEVEWLVKETERLRNENKKT